LLNTELTETLIGTILVIYIVFPSSTSRAMSVVLLLVLSLTYFNELNRTKIYFVALGYNYN